MLELPELLVLPAPPAPSVPLSQPKERLTTATVSAREARFRRQAPVISHHCHSIGGPSSRTASPVHAVATAVRGKRSVSVQPGRVHCDPGGLGSGIVSVHPRSPPPSPFFAADHKKCHRVGVTPPLGKA